MINTKNHPSPAQEEQNNAATPSDDADFQARARASVAMSARETVERYGSAAAEFIKGYRGVDNETGQTFAKGLKEIGEYNLNPDPEIGAHNLKQQAGFSAEVAATSRDNAKAIIAGEKQRTSRSDDLPQFGTNHNVVDRVQILDGQIIEGSQTQMKFVGDRNDLLGKIAREDGKFGRYRGVKLELPSEQFEGAKLYCEKQAESLRANAVHAEQHGKPDVAAKLRREAANYDALGENLRDSGLTTEQAVFYRKHPGLATLRDIAATSHEAGKEGAKYGALIGGGISLMKNAFAVAQEKKSVRDAAVDVALDVGKSAAVGYGTAAAGAAAKAVLQQSSRQGLRALAHTSAPALAVNVCLTLGGTVKRYVKGEINETELLVDVGEKSAGMLASGMMAALGQVLIPIPFVGAAIGGMIGYTLATMFYQAAREAGLDADSSREQLQRVRAIEACARARIDEECAALDAFMRVEMPQLVQQTQGLFLSIDTIGAGSTDAMAAAINDYARLLGKELQFSSIAEFDDFMASDAPLRL
jgi:hypothetical protein